MHNLSTVHAHTYNNQHCLNETIAIIVTYNITIIYYNLIAKHRDDYFFFRVN